MSPGVDELGTTNYCKECARLTKELEATIRRQLEHLGRLGVKLDLYKETIGHIKTTCADYRDQPGLGLRAILLLAKGAK